jgi:TetR/AcrR family transcriptional regulator, transcriptional repressor for nem operon
MNKKDKILKIAAEIVNRNGFNNTGIQEILDEAKIPKGSFYFYFKSKEDFGLCLIEYFFSCMNLIAVKHLQKNDVDAIEKLKGFFDELVNHIEQKQCKGGCGLGNLAQELADINENYRKKIDLCFRTIEEKLSKVLESFAIGAKFINGMNSEQMAIFILSSWEGAVLRSKITRTMDPILFFKKNLFNNLLKKGVNL